MIELDFYQIIMIILLLAIPSAIALGRFIQKTLARITRNSKANFRVKKAVLVLANRLDDINLEQHGKHNNLGPEIELLLENEKE